MTHSRAHPGTLGAGLLGILFLWLGASPGRAANLRSNPPAPGRLVPPALRLPDLARPLGYTVDLRLSPAAETFSGQVEIQIRLKERTPVLWLHSTALKIQEAWLRVGRTELQARPALHEPFLGLTLPRPVGPGEARLVIRYQGRLSDVDNQGLFRRRDGSRQYVFSQMEPLGARRAFPCWDEPGYKVPWQLTLHVPKEHVAVSNTPVAAEKDEASGTKLVRFARSRPLPTYLIALAVGPFDIVEAGRAGRKGTPVRILTPRGRAREAGFAKRAAPELLEVLERYFDRPYPYEKLDHLAVPQLGWGGMENAGLITYDDGALLSSPEMQTLGFERGSASILAHELAHQWFGNLVTMAWWDDLWLNEAFATWIAPKVLDRWKPQWNASLDEIRGRDFAMGSDRLATTRTVRQPIKTEQDIHSAFDGITYEKGAAVLQMLETWVGEEQFRTAIGRYLKRHAWGSATAQNFLEALRGAGPRDVRPVFSSFLDQAGVPLVSVQLRAGDTPTLRLRQQRYLPVGSTASTAQMWAIPLRIRCGSAQGVEELTTLLTGPEAEVPLPKGEVPRWVQVNVDQAGYYRVRYDEGLLDRLLDGGGPHLTPAERMGVLQDLGALLDSGDLPAGRALTLLPRLLQGEQRHILSSALGLVSRVGAWSPPALRPAYGRYLRQTFGDLGHRLGWKPAAGEDEDTRLLRPQLLALLAGPGEDPALRAQARPLAERWLADPAAVPAEIAPVVLRVAAIEGEADLFERFRSAARQSRDPEARRMLLGALGAFRNPQVVREALALLLRDEFPLSESLGILFSLGGYPENRDLALAFWREHFEALVQRLPASDAAVLLGIAGWERDEKQQEEVESFLRDRAPKLAGGPRRLAQVLERRSLLGAAKRLQGPSVEEFLRKQ